MLAALGIILMVLFLFLVPLGLPGVWLMLAVLAVAAGYGEVALATLAVLAALALAAEALEFVVVSRLSRRYGGSRLAFWGAIAGGLAGLAVGVPVPLVGPLLAGVAGTFLGAAAVTLWETRTPASAARVGWGATLGRALAAAVKTAVGVVVLAVGAGALLVR